MVWAPQLLASWARHSVDRGRNVLGLERITDDCVVVVTAVEVATSELSEKVSKPALRAMYSEIESYATLLDKNVGFLYLNYCDGSQDPVRSYGEENVKMMQKASTKYDPTRVFQERAPGGYKIPKVE